MRINIRTQEEEAVEEPADHLLCRQKRNDVEQKGEESGPVKDNTSTPRSKGPEPRREKEPAQPEPMIELPISPGR